MNLRMRARGPAAGWQGGRVAEKAIDMGVTKVISGDFGPKAKDLLEKFKVQMVILPNGNKTVEEIISLLK